MFTDVEYSRTGEVIRGRERAKARSKYEEDGTFSSPFLPSPLPRVSSLTSPSLRSLLSPPSKPHLRLGILLHPLLRHLGLLLLPCNPARLLLHRRNRSSSLQGLLGQIPPRQLQHLLRSYSPIPTTNISRSLVVESDWRDASSVGSSKL